ncbi:MAG: L-fuconate dehydratase (EC, type 2 [uncultured Caballeronia sp.]|nr:MAG: L-fuconate dehydratase (EC, type 2 [uncultured Caballeronia sp.]
MRLSCDPFHDRPRLRGKVCANPATFRNLSGDMDVDAGRILEGRATLDKVGREIFDVAVAVAAGAGVEIGGRRSVIRNSS